MQLDIKLILSVLSAIISVLAYIPYIRGIIKGKIRPHAFSWLIWTITLGTAVVAMWQNGGGYAAYGLTVGVVSEAIVFLFALKFGTKDITRGDKISLVTALVAIVIWWQMSEPLIAVVTVALIDAVGYYPSYRKLWIDKKSEKPFFWLVIVVAGFLALGAVGEYNLVTVTYVLVLIIANFGMFVLSLRQYSIFTKKS